MRRKSPLIETLRSEGYRFMAQVRVGVICFDSVRAISVTRTLQRGAHRVRALFPGGRPVFFSASTENA